MNKKEALNILFSCSECYSLNLENKNVLFIYGNLDNPFILESIFLARNFLHLTGVDPSKISPYINNDFYKDCVDKRLTINDFEIDKKGMAERKLAVLPQLMQIYKTARMIGDYNFTKTLLMTDKLAGTVKACMGFVHDEKFYIPNTVLKEDIRDITLSPQKKILASFKKNLDDKLYSELTYIAKDIFIDSLYENIIINHLIDFENLHSDFQIPYDRDPESDFNMKL